MEVPNEKYWRSQFIFLVGLFNTPSNSRKSKIDNFIRDIIPTSEVIQTTSLVEQDVIKIIGQYAMNVSEINEPKHFASLIHISNLLINRIKRTPGSMVYKFIRDELIIQLRKQLEYMIGFKQSLDERDASEAAAIAAKEKREKIRIAMSKFIYDEGAMAAFHKHLELYRLQEEVINKLEKDNVFPGCRDALINALRIEVPTHEMYYKKYMNGGARSKKSKTRRRR